MEEGEPKQGVGLSSQFLKRFIDDSYLNLLRGTSREYTEYGVDECITSLYESQTCHLQGTEQKSRGYVYSVPLSWNLAKNKITGKKTKIKKK